MPVYIPSQESERLCICMLEPGKWEIMYMYVGLIRFASVPIRLWNIYDSVALFAFHFINDIQNQKIDNA